MARRKRRAFTAEFKIEAVRLAKESGKSVGQVARDLDLTETALRAWVKQVEDKDKPAPAAALAPMERQELEQLRKEVRTLRMEREILKNHLGRRPACWTRSSGASPCW